MGADNKRKAVLPSFDYTPLECPSTHVRLLRRGSSEHWEISTFLIDEAPSYQALSYTWTTNLDRERIMIRDTTFLAPTNLIAFLRTGCGKGSWWWIDQISINQQDVPERNAQVQIMATIYNKANKVIVWLDSSSRQTQEVLNIDLNSTNLMRMSDHRKAVVASAIKEFSAHAYWSRVWIVQELLFAQSVEIAYATGYIPMQRVRHVLLKTMRDRIPARCAWLIEHAASLATDAEARLFRLDELIRTCGDSVCQDPRDIIYGIVGLVKWNQRPVIDYSKSVIEVYLDAAQKLVLWGNGMLLRDLVGLCLKLGAQMLPHIMAIERIFDRMDRLNAIVKDGHARGLIVNELRRLTADNCVPQRAVSLGITALKVHLDLPHLAFPRQEVPLPSNLPRKSGKAESQKSSQRPWPHRPAIPMDLPVLTIPPPRPKSPLISRLGDEVPTLSVEHHGLGWIDAEMCSRPLYELE